MRVSLSSLSPLLSGARASWRTRVWCVSGLHVIHVVMTRPRVCVPTAGGPCVVRHVPSLQCTDSSVDTWPPAQPRAQASQLYGEGYLGSKLTVTSGDSEDVSLPVRHILALRCLLLKVLGHLEWFVVFDWLFHQTHNTRAWERLQRLRGHHGRQAIQRSMEDNVADYGFRDLAVFIWYW